MLLGIKWDEFFESYWETKPNVFRGESSTPIVTEEELFNAMIKAARSWKETGNSTFHMWVNNQSVKDYECYIPTNSDETLLSYIDRITGKPIINEFTYYQGKIQLHSEQIWSRIHNITRELIKLIGIPTKGISIDSFVGRYGSTPRGIHTDAASTFMCVIHGCKKMLVWPPDFFNKMDLEIKGSKLHKTIINLDYKTVADKAILLEGYPGDILYWPSNYWHIGVSDNPEDMVAIMNIGMFFGEQQNSLLNKVVMELIDSILSDFHLTKTYPYNTNENCISKIPKVEQNALTDLRKIINSNKVEELIEKYWLELVSAGGFRHVPQFESVEIDSRSTKFVVNTNVSIILDKRGNEIILYTNGTSCKLRYELYILELLKVINSGVVFTIESLQLALTILFSDDIPKIKELVIYLYSRRMIQIIG